MSAWNICFSLDTSHTSFLKKFLKLLQEFKCLTSYIKHALMDLHTLKVLVVHHPRKLLYSFCFTYSSVSVGFSLFSTCINLQCETCQLALLSPFHYYLHRFVDKLLRITLLLNADLVCKYVVQCRVLPYVFFFLHFSLFIYVYILLNFNLAFVCPYLRFWMHLHHHLQSCQETWKRWWIVRDGKAFIHKNCTTTKW